MQAMKGIQLQVSAGITLLTITGKYLHVYQTRMTDPVMILAGGWGV
jgi:hypothetical protein